MASGRHLGRLGSAGGSTLTRPETDILNNLIHEVERLLGASFESPLFKTDFNTGITVSVHVPEIFPARLAGTQADGNYAWSELVPEGEQGVLVVKPGGRSGNLVYDIGRELNNCTGIADGTNVWMMPGAQTMGTRNEYLFFYPTLANVTTPSVFNNNVTFNNNTTMNGPSNFMNTVQFINQVNYYTQNHTSYYQNNSLLRFPCNTTVTSYPVLPVKIGAGASPSPGDTQYTAVPDETAYQGSLMYSPGDGGTPDKGVWYQGSGTPCTNLCATWTKLLTHYDLDNYTRSASFNCLVNFNSSTTGIRHNELLNLVWNVSNHIGTNLAGFNNEGNTINVVIGANLTYNNVTGALDANLAASGLTLNHRSLTNLVWNVSNHVGTNLAGFNTTGVAGNVVLGANLTYDAATFTLDANVTSSSVGDYINLPAAGSPPTPSAGTATVWVDSNGELRMTLADGTTCCHPCASTPGILDDAVHYWQMTESAGNDREDSIDSNPLEEARYDAGAASIGTGTGVDGDVCADLINGDFFQTTNTVDLGGSDWSITGWIRPEATLDPALTGISQMISIAGESAAFRLNTSGTDTFIMTVDGVTATSTVTPAIDTWFMFYIQYDVASKKCGISINAETLAESTAFGGTHSSAANAIVIGCGSGTVAGLVGKIQKVIIREKTLSASQLTTLYNSGSGGVSLGCGQIPVSYIPSSIPQLSITTSQISDLAAISDHRCLTNLVWNVSNHVGTNLAGFNDTGVAGNVVLGANLVYTAATFTLDTNLAASGLTTNHRSLTNLVWNVSNHTGTNLAGFNDTGIPINVVLGGNLSYVAGTGTLDANLAASGLTLNHRSLTNLVWNVSNHTGANLAGFNDTGVAGNVVLGANLTYDAANLTLDANVTSSGGVSLDTETGAWLGMW